MAGAKATDANSATADAFDKQKAYILHLIMEWTQRTHNINYSYLLPFLVHIQTHSRFTNLQRRYHLCLLFFYGNERLWGTVTNEIAAFNFEGMAEAGYITRPGATEPYIIRAMQWADLLVCGQKCLESSHSNDEREDETITPIIALNLHACGKYVINP